MNDAKNEVTGRDVFNDKTQRNKVVDAVDILVVFGELFVQGIDGFDAAIAFVFDFFFLESVFDGALGVFELFVGLFEVFFGEVLKEFEATWVEVAEAGFLDLDTDVSHLEAVSERGEDFE